MLPVAVAVAAISAGLLVFAVVVWRQPAAVADLDRPVATGDGGRIVALPAPGVTTRQAVEMPRAAPAAADTGGDAVESPARLVDTAPPAPTPPAPLESGRPPAPASAGDGATRAPVPVDMPPPRYPADALRRGDTGEVLLRVQVDARGLPAGVEVRQSSGSRALDRAAVAAAQRWRFEPAQRDGVAVTGSVDVPIAFDRPR